MQLKVFQRFSKKQKSILGVMISIVLFLSLLFLIRTYSMYAENQEFSMISGIVPNQNYDLKFVFVVDDEGNKSYVKKIPEGKKYMVTVECNNGATGYWDYERWAPIVNNLKTTQTKCKIVFEVVRPLKEYGIKESLTKIESGLYEVHHEDAEITYTNDVNEQNVLKETEYRYAGSNPNNYVWFNEELWRLIGLVNTPEGQRIKIIRDESIGEYSWDSSESSINGGYGVNEWAQADLMNLLNNGAYYNRCNGTCYNGTLNQTVSCDFRETGLMEEAKKMIDTITWNTGSWDLLLLEADAEKMLSDAISDVFYNLERSGYSGKQCGEGVFCTDSIVRMTTWKGQIGLMYLSDYGYATSGGNITNRDTCEAKSLFTWTELADCRNNDWMFNESEFRWSISPVARLNNANGVFSVGSGGSIDSGTAVRAIAVLPSLYLKSNIKLVSGDGTFDRPFILEN